MSFPQQDRRPSQQPAQNSRAAPQRRSTTGRPEEVPRVFANHNQAADYVLSSHLGGTQSTASYSSTARAPATRSYASATQNTEYNEERSERPSSQMNVTIPYRPAPGVRPAEPLSADTRNTERPRTSRSSNSTNQSGSHASDQASLELVRSPARNPSISLAISPQIHASMGPPPLLSQHNFQPNEVHRYEVRPSSFYVLGRVVAIPWHENASTTSFAGRRSTSIASTPAITHSSTGDPIHSRKRRMIVVRNRRGCSWVVPISTYNEQACCKSGIEVDAHAVIHMSNALPRLRPGEPRMIKQHIVVDPASYATLSANSRVNFAKVHTIEHNTAVLNVGKVKPDSLDLVLHYFEQECIIGRQQPRGRV